MGVTLGHGGHFGAWGSPWDMGVTLGVTLWHGGHFGAWGSLSGMGVTLGHGGHLGAWGSLCVTVGHGVTFGSL